MTAENERRSERELETLFAAERARTPQPSAALLERVLADAYANQPPPQAAALPPAAPHRPAKRGALAGLLDAVGGWPAVAGLAAVALAGLWFGYAPPAALDTLALAFLDGGAGLTMDGTLPDHGFLLADG